MTFSFENSFFHRPFHTLHEYHKSMVNEKKNQDNEKKNQTNGKICISLPPEQIKIIDEKRGLIPRSTFISEMVDIAWLANEDEEEKEKL